MLLSDTVEYMVSKDWKERLKAEYWQTSIRLDNLNAYIESDEIMDNPDGGMDLILLTTQRDIMYAYLTSIYNRAIVLGIDDYLNETSDMTGYEEVSDNEQE